MVWSSYCRTVAEILVIYFSIWHLIMSRAFNIEQTVVTYRWNYQRLRQWDEDSKAEQNSNPCTSSEFSVSGLISTPNLCNFWRRCTGAVNELRQMSTVDISFPPYCRHRIKWPALKCGSSPPILSNCTMVIKQQLPELTTQTKDKRYPILWL